MNYNPQIYHRRSIRLKGYNYSQAGAYFITICTTNRACLFGHIFNGKMILNDAGKIAFDAWMQTPNIRSNIELDAFVVMPNHIHGIVIIHGGELHSPGYEKGECNSPLRSPSNNIGAIVRGYKSSVTRQIRLLNHSIDVVWQRNYYGHIIRDEMSYERIAEYINNNPLKWNEDRFYK